MAIVRTLRFEDAFIVTLPNGEIMKIQAMTLKGTKQVRVSVTTPLDCKIDFLKGEKNESLEHD